MSGGDLLRRRGLVWLLVLTLGLAGCSFVRQEESVPALRGEAVTEGTGIRFRLYGYAGEEVPSLQVVSADGKDWSGQLGRPEQEGDGYTVKLSGEKGTARLAVEQFTYTWTMPDGQTAGGDVLFSDWRFKDLPWKLTRSGGLLVYHANPLQKGQAESWAKALERVEQWTGQRRDEQLVIWVFPTIEHLNEWAYRSRVELAGLWFQDIARLVVYDERNADQYLVLMLHEMVHAVHEGEGPAWYAEGVAQVLESRQERLLLGDQAPRWQERADTLGQLSKRAMEGEVLPSQSERQLELGMDPYTVGASIWLFVRRHHGEEGLQRFFREGGGENGVKLTLEAMFEQDLPAIWADWNAYLRSPDLLTDWQSP